MRKKHASQYANFGSLLIKPHPLLAKRPHLVHSDVGAFLIHCILGVLEHVTDTKHD